MNTGAYRRVRVYGIGVVAPGAADLAAFRPRVMNGQTMLTPLTGDARTDEGVFLAGRPSFDFRKHAAWIDSRCGPRRSASLVEKSGQNVLMALGSLIEPLSQSPALEAALKRLDTRVRISIASGLGDLPTSFEAARAFDRASWRWDEFWAAPERNPELAQYLASGAKPDGVEVPVNPATLAVDTFARVEALRAWNAYWAARNPGRAALIRELGAIDSVPIGEPIESSRLAVIRAKAKARRDLYSQWECPLPPWEMASANLLWNIANAPAAQVSMLLGLHGQATGIAAACASFGTVLHESMLAIQHGDFDAAIVGAVDAAPTPEIAAAFYAGRLTTLGLTPSLPFCGLRGTHISGGACTWIIAAEDAFPELQPLPVEIIGTGVSGDAAHIITPSQHGPKQALRMAFANAGVYPDDIDTWDMHATATPGDLAELTLIDEFVPKDAPISARKGIFGHGMSVAGGWELTAVAVGGERLGGGRLRLPPSGIPAADVHPEIRATGRRFILDEPVDLDAGVNGSLIAGKLSLGVGGISSCVMLRLFV